MRAPEETVIVAGRAGGHYLRELWRFRELLFFLAWRDLLVRYKQTVVGIAWSVFKPVVTVGVLTVVFGKLGNMPSGGVPYPLLVLCGVLPWQFFASALSESGNSLVANSGLVAKVYFPRLVIPISSLVTAMADFLVSLVILVALMVRYRWLPPTAIVWLPLFILLGAMASLGFGLFFAALTVRYRDFRFIVPFVVQFGLYISPVGFTSSVVPQEYRMLHAINPMVGVIDGFRWCILGGEHTLYVPSLLVSLVVTVVTLVSGIVFFRRTERTFADVI